MNNRIVRLVIAAAIAMGAGLWVGSALFGNREASSPMLGNTAFIYPRPREIPEFALQSHDGSVFDKSSLEGKWSFMFFGYSHCPDVCPMTLDMFSQVHRDLGQGEGGVGDTQFVFVSVDPERDTPEILDGFVTFFNPEFVGVTGPKEQIDHLTPALGIVYAKVAETTNPESYLVDHSSAVLLADPQGRLYAVFTAPHKAAAIAQAFREIRAHEG